MEIPKKYKERLSDYDLGDYTKQQYLYYYKKIYNIIGELEITEEIANAFLKDYPNSVCMAFLQDYKKWKRLDYQLEDRVVKRKPKKAKRYITPKEIKILGNWLKENYGIKYKIMLQLAYECALRRKETIGLNINYLMEDYQKYKEGKPLRITINKESAKGKKERIAVLNPKLAKLLLKYILIKEEKILNTDHKNNVFRVKRSRWHTVFKEAVRKALKKDYTLHELRFSKATYWWREKGFDIVRIQKLLGHANIGTTQRYIDPSQETALRELEALYGG